MKGQLAAWIKRVEEVWAAPPLPAPSRKTFQAKNALPRLRSYREDPVPGFWEKFPVNKEAAGWSLIKGDKLRVLAERVGYRGAKLDLVLKDLGSGADVGCRGNSRKATWSGNAASAYEFGEQVTDAVASWVVNGFVMGPVDRADLPGGVKVNGIMCREKPNGSVRIILNMSAPEGESVNDGIDLSEFPAVMSSTAKWLKALERAGRGCYIMKLDWSDAYKHIRVRKEDVALQWFSWLGKYFVELCLIFGTSSSVGIYDRAAKVVLELVLLICGFLRELVCQHLDDVCAAGGQELFDFERTYRMVAEEVGVKLAPTDDPDKAFSPCHQGTVLGVYYDTVEWTWCIPADKLSRLMGQLRAAMDADCLRQDEIWSLVGRVLHYCPLVPAGRFNIDHLIKANGVSSEKKRMVELSPAFKRQVWFWLTMVRVSSGHCRIPDPEDRFPVWTRECYTDSAGGSMGRPGRGAGVVSESWWCYYPWARKVNCGVRAEDGKKLGRKLSALELVGPLICLTAGSSWCRNRPVRVWVDNMGSVKIWKKGYSPVCGLCTTLVKAISAVAAGLGCRFTIEKITRCSGAGAVMADCLSKADFNGFRRTALEAGWGLDVGPGRIPGSVLRWLENPVVDDQLGGTILREMAGESEILGYC